jgi:hypothetical protein
LQQRVFVFFPFFLFFFFFFEQQLRLVASLLLHLLHRLMLMLVQDLKGRRPAEACDEGTLVAVRLLGLQLVRVVVVVVQPTVPGLHLFTTYYYY